ncbi:MAG: LytR/AlgR family response regulator transcription factor [Bacteroidota bacterium]|jgi:DNA-binding LytR/AlgR family response regulator
MNCIIVDDDDLSRFAINHFVEKTPGLNLIGSYSNAAEALLAIRENDVHLIFLDVEMPEMSGLQFLDTFENLPQVVMVTVNKEYGADAFDYNVTDFLLKPVEYARFLKSVDKARAIEDSFHVGPSGSNDIFIKKDHRLIRLPLSEILFVEALADYVNIYTTSNRFTVLSTMKSIENKLPTKDFCRVHRSFLVRVDKIKEIEDNAITIEDKTIPVSRSYKDHLLKKINLF